MNTITCGARWTTAVLFGAICTMAIVSPAVAKKTPTEVNDIAQGMTVRIESSIEAENGQGTNIGTGVILQQQGNFYTILTAAHVVKLTTANYTIFTPDGKQYLSLPSSVRHLPGDLDLAILRFQSAGAYPIAKLGDASKLKIGMRCYVAGFPAPTAVITDAVYVFRSGDISANSNKTFAKGYSLLYSNDTLPGMSGGPVLNEEGEIVAIHGRGDRNAVTGEKTGFNAGIPMYRFTELAASLGVNISTQIAKVPMPTALQADDLFIAAYGKSERKDYRGAITDYDRAIAIDPNYATAYNNRGNLKSEQFQDLTGALADYDRAIALNPTLAQAYYSRGVVKNRQANRQGALIDYNRAIAINPNYAEAYNNRGIIYQDLKDFPRARTDYDRAIALNPNYIEAYYNRGAFKTSLNDSRNAIIDYDRAIALNPNYAEAHNNRGITHEQLGNNDLALADFNRALTINPKSVAAYNNRGNFQFQHQQNSQAALADYNLAISINPNSAESYLNRSLLSEELGNSQGALQDARSALKFAIPKSVIAFFSSGSIDYQQKLFDQSIGSFDRAIAVDPTFADAYLRRGLAKIKLGDRTNAVADLRKSAQLFQQQGQVYSLKQATISLQQLGIQLP